MKATRHFLLAGMIFLLLGIITGAFGGHALKPILYDKYLTTYRIGIRYMMYHGIGLSMLGLLAKQFPKANFRISACFMIIGVLFFSLNCIIYAISKEAFFAKLIPIGGTSFMVAWIIAIYQTYKHVK